MDIKKSKIIINLNKEEKNNFNNFYDFLDDMTRKLYEAEAEHTGLCTIATHIMKEIMALYDFWGDILEEEPEHEETEEAWDYIHEMTKKFLFYDYDGNLIHYPTITIGLKVGEWIDEFWNIYSHASSLRVFEELSKSAHDFFLAYTEFVLLDAKVGYYTYDTCTHEWKRIFTSIDKMKFIEELEKNYLFLNDMHPIQFVFTTNPIDWKNDFLKQSATFTHVVVSNPLSEEAQQFFSQEWSFDIPYKRGTYTYDSETEKWSSPN